MITACRRCHAEIIWATTLLGRPMPLDPDPADDGNVAVWTDHSQLRCRVLSTGQQTEPFETRYRTHFATCSPQGQTRKAAAQ
jgi:hypothetical protein